MSTTFKRTWTDIHKNEPMLDVQTLDFEINNLTVRMAEAPTYSDWSNLYHERERTQILRNALAQSL